MPDLKHLRQAVREPAEFVTLPQPIAIRLLDVADIANELRVRLGNTDREPTSILGRLSVALDALDGAA